MDCYVFSAIFKKYYSIYSVRASYMKPLSAAALLTYTTTLHVMQTYKCMLQRSDNPCHMICQMKYQSPMHMTCICTTSVVTANVGIIVFLS